MPKPSPRPVLFVHHRGELGGAPTSLSQLIGALDRERFEPHVYCPAGPAADRFREAGAVVHIGRVAGFTHIWASVYRGRRWLLFARELLRLPSHVVSFRRTLARESFDLVHVNDSPPLVAGWLARRRGIPVVWHLRSALPAGDTGLRARLIRATIRRLSAATIAINEDVAASFRLGSEVVSNPVDLVRFAPGDREAARDALGIVSERPLVSYFGYLYPSKGFREFILAAAKLRDRGVDADFLMVGGAVRGESFFKTHVGRLSLALDLARNYEQEALQLVRSLGLEDRLRFVPFTLDTSRYYQASDVVVAPPRGPEIGRPVLEAAASGVAVVTSGSSSGGGSVVPDETAVVISDHTVDALADAVADLLGDPERAAQLGRAARALAETKYDPALAAARIEAVYTRFLRSDGRIPILFVHHRPQLGGAPTSLAALISNLDERYEPHVFTPGGPAAELFEASGAIVHTGEASIFSHIWDNPYRRLRWLLLGLEGLRLVPHVRGLAELMRRYRFELVHLNDSPLLPAAAVAHRHGAKVVWHLRSALAGEGRDARSRLITTLIQRWGDAMIAIDEDVARRFPVRLPLRIVHNSVVVREQAGDVAETRAQLGVPEGSVAVGFSGFVRRPKGWPEFVAAAELLIRSGKPAHFVVVGGGVRSPAFFRTLRGRLLLLGGVVADEETAINELVAEKGLSGHFSFVPFTAATGEVYRALDVVTFPNQGVGLGRPVLEAAMYGKPVVASGSATGAGILLHERTGILVPDPSPRHLADAIGRLVDDPELRREMGAAAMEHARENFDPAQNAHAVEQLYAELLDLDRGDRRRTVSGSSLATAPRRR